MAAAAAANTPDAAQQQEAEDEEGLHGVGQGFGTSRNGVNWWESREGTRLNAPATALPARRGPRLVLVNKANQHSQRLIRATSGCSQRVKPSGRSRRAGARTSMPRGSEGAGRLRCSVPFQLHGFLELRHPCRDWSWSEAKTQQTKS